MPTWSGYSRMKLPSSDCVIGPIGVCQRATPLEPMRQVMALWDSVLREALGLVPPDDKVVVLKAARATR